MCWFLNQTETVCLVRRKPPAFWALILPEHHCCASCTWIFRNCHCQKGHVIILRPAVKWSKPTQHFAMRKLWMHMCFDADSDIFWQWHTCSSFFWRPGCGCPLKGVTTISWAWPRAGNCVFFPRLEPHIQPVALVIFLCSNTWWLQHAATMLDLSSFQRWFWHTVDGTTVLPGLSLQIVGSSRPFLHVI